MFKLRHNFSSARTAPLGGLIFEFRDELSVVLWLEEWNACALHGRLQIYGGFSVEGSVRGPQLQCPVLLNCLG